MMTVVTRSLIRCATVAGVTFGLLACVSTPTSVSSTQTTSQRSASQLAARDLVAGTSTATPDVPGTRQSAATATASQANAAATVQARYTATLTAANATAAAQWTGTAAVFAVTRTAIALTHEATLEAIKHPPPTPANEATRSASSTASIIGKATAVAQSRKPAPAPTFDTSTVVGGVELDLPMTLGELQRRLDSDTHRWSVNLTDRSCKGNLETLTADTRAIEAEIYCTAGASAQPNNSVVRITAGAPFGGTVKGVSIGSTRADVTRFLRGYKLTENFDRFTGSPPDLDVSIPSGRAGGPAGQYLNFEFAGSYADYGETVYSITLGDARYFIYSIPVPATRP